MNHSEQARLLYTLLDAAEDEGRLPDPSVAEKWRTLKQRFDNSHCEQEVAALHALLDEIDRTGALVGTWIQGRWHTLRARSVDPGSQTARRRLPVARGTKP